MRPQTEISVEFYPGLDTGTLIRLSENSDWWRIKGRVGKTVFLERLYRHELLWHRFVWWWRWERWRWLRKR